MYYIPSESPTQPINRYSALSSEKGPVIRCKGYSQGTAIAIDLGALSVLTRCIMVAIDI